MLSYMISIKTITSASGKDLIEEFITSLKGADRQECIDTIDLLSEYGFMLSSKYIKKLTNKPKLWELRVSGKNEYRLLFTYKNQVATIVHAFTKKTTKTPQKEIALASNRLKRI